MSGTSPGKSFSVPLGSGMTPQDKMLLSPHNFGPQELGKLTFVTEGGETSLTVEAYEGLVKIADVSEKNLRRLLNDCYPEKIRSSQDIDALKVSLRVRQAEAFTATKSSKELLKFLRDNKGRADDIDFLERFELWKINDFDSLHKTVSEVLKTVTDYFEGKETTPSDSEKEVKWRKMVDSKKEETKEAEAPSRRGSSEKEGASNEKKGPSYSEMLNNLELKKVSWADIVEEELSKEVVQKMTDLSGSLVSVIRSKKGLAQENRIEIPGNLEEELPKVYERFCVAANLAGCELVKNPKIEIKLSRKDVWGSDEKSRNDVLESLYDETGNPKQELLDIADVAVVTESILELPDADSVGIKAPGRTGIVYVLSLFIRIYCEQAYNAPIAKQRRWWKGNEEVRKMILNRIAEQFGEGAAPCFMNAFDIIYRKFIRKTLQSAKKDSKEKKQKMANMAIDVSKKLFVSGGALYNSLLRQETRTKMVEIETIVKGRKIKKLEAQKYVARIKPHIVDGPKTGYENGLYSKINNALSKMDSKAINYDLASKEYPSPTEWEESHRIWIERVYSKTSIPSSIMARRKQLIRSKIIAEKTKKASSTGESKTLSAADRKITSDEWKILEARLISEEQEKFDTESVTVINQMLGSEYSQSELLSVTEDEIISCLGR